LNWYHHQDKIIDLKQSKGNTLYGYISIVQLHQAEQENSI